MTIREIHANAFSLRVKKAKKEPEIQIFKASLRDIELTLKPKPKGDPSKLLPTAYNDYIKAFSREAEVLPRHRPGVDHKMGTC